MCDAMCIDSARGVHTASGVKLHMSIGGASSPTDVSNEYAKLQHTIFVIRSVQEQRTMGKQHVADGETHCADTRKWT